MKKQKIAILIALLLIVAVSAVASASENIRVFVDGKAVAFPDQKPYLDKNSRTLVPVRFVSEALGAKVDWDNTNRQVTVTDEVASKAIKLWVGKKEYEVNGVKQTMDTEAILTAQSRVMVPMRFVSEGLGVFVDYKNIEGLGLVFNFTREFPKETIQETIDRISEEIRKEFSDEWIHGFLKPSDNLPQGVWFRMRTADMPVTELVTSIQVPEDIRYEELRRVFTSKYPEEIFNEIVEHLSPKKEFYDTVKSKRWIVGNTNITAYGARGYSLVINIVEH